MLEKINEEYFQNQLDTFFEDEDDLKNSILTKYMFDEDKDIYITQNDELDKEDEVECIKKLQTTRGELVLYLYVVKVDRSDLPKKPLED